MIDQVFGGPIIIDLDGTLIDLNVDWGQLRKVLGVTSITELWRFSDQSIWSKVSDAELNAAKTSRLNDELIALIGSSSQVAVFSNNSNCAIEETLRRIGEITKNWLIVGREFLGGAKEDFTIFSRGIEWTVQQWDVKPESASYVGDAVYEVDFARRLGLNSWRISDW